MKERPNNGSERDSQRDPSTEGQEMKSTRRLQHSALAAGKLRVGLVATLAALGVLAVGPTAGSSDPGENAIVHRSGVAHMASITARAFAGGARAAPSEFSLTFVGRHVVDPAAPTGLHHEGHFTASAPFCPSGTAIDTRHDLQATLSVERTHTCDDGSGSIIVSMPDVAREHQQGGSGFWKIIGGTGKYDKLRGSGTCSGQILSGDPFDFSTVTYRTTWQGQVGFDADPPALSLTGTATKLKLPKRTYLLRVGLVVRNEEAGARVTYSLTAQAPGQIVPVGSRQGSTTAGRAAFTLRITPPRAARTVQISVRATDPLGNESTTTKRVSLP